MLQAFSDLLIQVLISLLCLPDSSAGEAGEIRT